MNHVFLWPFFEKVYVFQQCNARRLQVTLRYYCNKRKKQDFRGGGGKHRNESHQKNKMRADYFPLACMHAQQVLTKTYLDKQHFLHQKKNERRLFIVAELTHTPNASL